MYWKGTSNIKCPYYLSEHEKTITCEGVVSTNIMQRFDSKGKKEEFQEKNCFKYPNECPYFKLNEGKYK